MLFTEKNNLKIMSCVLCIVLGVLLGIFTSNIPVSQQMVRLRLLSVVSCLILSLAYFIVHSIAKRFTNPDDLVIDYDTYEMYDEIKVLSKRYWIFGFISSILGLGFTFALDFHIWMMPYVCSGYYVLFLFFIGVPSICLLGLFIKEIYLYFI